MKTVITNQDSEVIIERGKPSVIIGERISTVGFKKIKEAIEEKDYNFILKEAEKQIKAGAKILDICVISQKINETEILPEIVKLISQEFKIPLSIEYSNPAALEKALIVYQGKPIINSFTGEEEKIAKVLPILRKYKPAVIVLPCDNKHGIPKEAQTRIEVAKNIIRILEDEGLNREDIIIDCIVTAAATDVNQVKEQFETLKLIKDELRLNATAGASNISFGLPDRKLINSHFLSAAITYGLNMPITDPTDEKLKEAILIGDFFAGNDEYAMNYINYSRSKR